MASNTRKRKSVRKHKSKANRRNMKKDEKRRQENREVLEKGAESGA